MNKSMAKVVGILVGASTVIGALAAHAANGDKMLINPNDGVPYGSWGPAVTAVNIFGTASVRGEVSKRHSRERLFYNTSSASGPYDRALHIGCNGQTPQDSTGFAFQNTTDGDLTLFCANGAGLVLPPPDMTVAQATPDSGWSWAWIQSRAF